jgi:hypothetical protein
MTKGTGYRWLAGVADVCFLSLLLGTIAAVATSSIGRPLPLIGAVALLSTTIMCSVFYHAGVAGRIAWVSPGERMHGCDTFSGTKRWTNPFGRNRWALFTLNLMAVILVSNAWDGLGEGVLYRPGEIIGKVAFIAVVAGGTVALGRGRYLGVIGPLLLYLIWGIGMLTLAPSTADPEAVRTTAFIFFGLGALHFCVATWYWLRRPSQTSTSGHTQVMQA